MDGSAFRNLDFGFLKWVIPLAAFGFITLVCLVSVGAWWVVSHLQWVP